MKITSDEVQNVARLARLDLSAAETELMTRQLDRILQYVDKLNELDTAGVEPTTHALSVTNAFRDDTVTESLPRSAALANAPLQNGEAFIVPKII